MASTTEQSVVNLRSSESEVFNYLLTIMAATALLGNLVVMSIHAAKTIFRPRNEQVSEAAGIQGCSQGELLAAASLVANK